jgi:isocitrate dehydrogenase kinase/phosphatase
MAVPRSRTASASRLANEIAPDIVEAFDAYERGFGRLTRGARSRFEAREWRGAISDAIERLELYTQVIEELELRIRAELDARVSDRMVWAAMKAVYSGLIADRDDGDLAETFFSSLTRRIFATEGVDGDIEYVESDVEEPQPAEPEKLLRTYQSTDPDALLEAILGDGWLDCRFEDPQRDARAAARLVREQLRELGIPESGMSGAEILAAPLFRRKGAYLVGRLLTGSSSPPLVLALLNGEGGVVVDAVLTDVEDVSILFSFTRSHFSVDLQPASALVGYLKLLLPRKPVAELYIALGYHKHGKTLLYRDLVRRLAETSHQFEPAPGTPGMVMLVFTLPGYDVVFKVIRDHFPAIKHTTRASVRENYRLVFRHDRAGRLVEAQEFEHMKFERSRFSDEMVEEFSSQADRTITTGEDEVVVHHAYLERRVTPLDVYLTESDEATARAAVIDFGQCVKDLAANGIFPGELLPKNFGVTRHGRVVCYDYDELGLLTDFVFREMPESGDPQDDLGEDAWFGVGPRDLFPEEFRRFIGLAPELLAHLDEEHSELYDPRFWQGMQNRVESGEIIDIFPYVPARRL